MNTQIVTVKPLGRIDSNTAKGLRQQLESISHSNIKTLILDMQSVVFMDSFGLGMLISVLKLSRAMKFDFIIHSITSEQVKDLLILTQTYKLLKIESECLNFKIREYASGLQ